MQLVLSIFTGTVVMHWRTGKLQVTISSKIDSSSLSSHHLRIAFSTEVEFMGTNTIHARILTILALCKFCVGSQNIYELI